MNPIVRSFFHKPTFTASHVIVDPETRQAAVIDPVLDFDPKSGRTGTVFANDILAAAAGEGAQIVWILETHAHADHLTAAPYLKEKTAAAVAIGVEITRVQKVFKPIFNAAEMAPPWSPRRNPGGGAAIAIAN